MLSAFILAVVTVPTLLGADAGQLSARDALSFLGAAGGAAITVLASWERLLAKMEKKVSDGIALHEARCALARRDDGAPVILDNRGMVTARHKLPREGGDE